MNPNNMQVILDSGTSLWNQLLPCLDKTLCIQNISRQEYMNLYTHLYDYPAKFVRLRSRNEYAASHDCYEYAAHDLRSRLSSFLTDYLLNLFTAELDSDNGNNILHFYSEKWKKYQCTCQVLDHLYAQTVRFAFKYKTPEQCKKLSFSNLALSLWRDHVFERLHKQIIRAILKLIECEHMGELINANVVKDAINSFIQLSEFSPNEDNLMTPYALFESSFLEDIENFYTAKDLEMLKNCTNKEYIKEVDQRLNDEYKRSQMYLHRNTFPKLMPLLIPSKHLDIFYTEFQTLLDESPSTCRNYDLKLIYSLIIKKGCGLRELKPLLEKHIVNHGVDIMNGCGEAAIKDPKTWVNMILKVHHKYNPMIVELFNGVCEFESILHIACKKLVNSKYVSSGNSAELLAKYCDLLLKKPSRRKHVEERELESNLDQIMIVLDYIEDKDIFQRLYAQMLAKRFLQQTSVNEDAEVAMILRLKQVCGYELAYAYRLQSMYQDILTSKDLTESFKKHPYSQKLHINFSVKVLSTAAWALQNSNFHFSLPPELEHCVYQFTAFYMLQHKSRKLHWLYNMSEGELVLNCFNRKKYTFLTSTSQMIILLQFNSGESFSVAHLAELTQMKLHHLIQVLKTILKLKVLQRTDKENDLSSSSVISFFSGYSNRKQKVNLIVPEEEQEMKREILLHKVEEDRRLSIDAAIIRIMKMRKSLEHERLLAEVFSQLCPRFKPKVNTIKKCIDSLIDREFLERECHDIKGKTDKRVMYKYLP